MTRRNFLVRILGIAPLLSPLLSPFVSGCKDELISNNVPLAPINVKVNGNVNSIRVNWDFPEESLVGVSQKEIIKFRVYRSSIPSNPFAFLAEVDGNTKVFEDRSLNKGEIFYYKISAVDENGNESALSQESNRAILSIQVEKTLLPEVGQAIYLNYSGAIVAENEIRSDLTLTKSNARFFALSRFCTHAGCSNMRFREGVWTCNCHGSQFDQTGKVITSPAQSNLEEFMTEMQPSGNIVIHLSVKS